MSAKDQDGVLISGAGGQLAPPSHRPGRNLWRAGFILLSSAALGGLAIAIWNRKSIDYIHGSSQDDDFEYQAGDEEI